MKQPAIYIMINQENGTLYTGVTSNLLQRVSQHKTSTNGFAAKHNCRLLVYYEIYDDMYSAISREKQLKGGSRKQKLKLINELNPRWQDLSEDIY